LKKVPNIIKKCLIFFTVFVSNQRKKTLQNGRFNFSRRWPYNLYMLFEKSYDMVLWFSVKINRKYFENFPHFLFKLNFLVSPAGNIEIATFYYIQICPRFVSSLLFILWIILFQTKLRFGRNPSKPSFIQNWKKFIALKLATLVSQPIYRVKFNKLNSWKKIFLSMC
jgi:hypothetical protein